MIVSLCVARRAVEAQIHHAVFLYFKGKNMANWYIKCEKSKCSCSVRETHCLGLWGEGDFLGNKGPVSFGVCSRQS